jgi:hypothetical protein
MSVAYKSNCILLYFIYQYVVVLQQVTITQTVYHTLQTVLVNSDQCELALEVLDSMTVHSSCYPNAYNITAGLMACARSGKVMHNIYIYVYIRYQL